MSYSTVTTTTTGAQTVTLTKSPNEGFVSLAISGTYGGLAFTLQGSYDGTNYVPIFCVDNSTGLPVTGATTISPTDDAEYSWTVPNAVNLTSVRLNVSALTSVTSLVVKSFGAPTMEGLAYSVTSATTGSFANVAATGSILSSGATSGIGYATGAGGTVTQSTDKSTGVTLSKITGAITMSNAALAAGAEVTFAVTNTAVDANDVIVTNHISGGTAGAYLVQANGVGSGTFNITVSNVSAGSLGEAIVIQFLVLKSVAA